MHNLQPEQKVTSHGVNAGIYLGNHISVTRKEMSENMIFDG